MEEKNKEPELIKAAKAGDGSAFIDLISPYLKNIYSVCFRIVHNHKDAEDIVQEAVVRAFEKIDSFEGKSSFFTWFCRIAINAGRDRLRRKRRRREVFYERTLPEGAALPGFAPGPDVEAEAREKKRLIAAALDSLPFKHRMTVILHDLEELNHREIAVVMKCSEGTVWSRLHYARKKLRRKLAKYFDKGYKGIRV